MEKRLLENAAAPWEKHSELLRRLTVEQRHLDPENIKPGDLANVTHAHLHAALAISSAAVLSDGATRLVKSMGIGADVLTHLPDYYKGEPLGIKAFEDILDTLVRLGLPARGGEYVKTEARAISNTLRNIPDDVLRNTPGVLPYQWLEHLPKRLGAMRMALLPKKPSDNPGLQIVGRVARALLQHMNSAMLTGVLLPVRYHGFYIIQRLQDLTAIATLTPYAAPSYTGRFVDSLGGLVQLDMRLAAMATQGAARAAARAAPKALRKMAAVDDLANGRRGLEPLTDYVPGLGKFLDMLGVDPANPGRLPRWSWTLMNRDVQMVQNTRDYGPSVLSKIPKPGGGHYTVGELRALIAKHRIMSTGTGSMTGTALRNQVAHFIENPTGVDRVIAGVTTPQRYYAELSAIMESRAVSGTTSTFWREGVSPRRWRGCCTGRCTTGVTPLPSWRSASREACSCSGDSCGVCSPRASA